MGVSCGCGLTKTSQLAVPGSVELRHHWGDMEISIIFFKAAECFSHKTLGFNLLIIISPLATPMSFLQQNLP